MTQEQRRQTRDALARYGQRGSPDETGRLGVGPGHR